MRCVPTTPTLTLKPAATPTLTPSPSPTATPTLTPSPTAAPTHTHSDSYKQYVGIGQSMIRAVPTYTAFITEHDSYGAYPHGIYVGIGLSMKYTVRTYTAFPSGSSPAYGHVQCVNTTPFTQSKPNSLTEMCVVLPTLQVTLRRFTFHEVLKQ